MTISKRILCFAFLWLGLAVLFSRAQDSIPVLSISGEWFTIKNGLSQGLVSKIIQDKEGYLWFATKDGLNRYDGYSVTAFKHNPNDQYSLPANHILDMQEDEYGNFWVACLNKGICLLDKRTEKFFPAVQPLRNSETRVDYTRSFLVNKNIMTIVSGDGVNVYGIDNKNMYKDTAHVQNHFKLLFSYSFGETNPANEIVDGSNSGILPLPDFSLLILHNDSLFHVRPGSDFKTWHWTRISLSAMGVTFNKKENVCLVTNERPSMQPLLLCENRIYQYDLNSDAIQLKYTIPEMTKWKTRSMHEMKNGDLFFNYNSFSYLYNPKSNKLSRLNFQGAKRELNSHSYPPFTDANGVEWYGTSGFGVFKHDTQKIRFKSYKTLSGTDFFYDQNNGYVKTLPLSLKQKITLDFNQIVQDKENKYWFATQFTSSTLYSYSTDKNDLQSYQWSKDTTGYPESIFSDHQNRLWMQWNTAPDLKMIYCVDKTHGQPLATYRIPIADYNYQYPFVSQWWQDGVGVMWLGTMKGLFSFNPDEKSPDKIWKQWQHIANDSSSLSDNMIFSICPDPKEPKRYLWIGTNGAGFNRFEFATGKCVQYNEANGLPNNVVYGIQSDGANNLWLSTNRGLSCFDPALKTFLNFFEDDGLQGDEFNRYGSMKFKNGDLLFGGVNGYTIFTPSVVLQKQVPVPIVFTGLAISNKPIDWKDATGILDAPIGYAKTITLYPGQSIFTVSFSTLEFRSNQKKLYKYRLHGFDDNWTVASSKNEATYTDLSPGTYKLYVTGTNTDGIWNKEAIFMSIIILPEWYQTWWFRSLILLLVIGAMYSLYRYRLAHQIKLITMRNRIATDLHDEIGSTLSSISFYSESAKKMSGSGDATNKILNKISDNATDVMESMSDIVWAINSRNDQFDSLMNRMRSFAIELSESKNFILHLPEHENISTMKMDVMIRKNLYLIFKEALNNAAKYSGCKNIWVEFSNERNRIKMIIRDDGKGFVVGDTAMPSSNRGGNGIYNMKKRAEELRGELLIMSTPGLGTEITLTFKLA